ncbi:MAG: hypothetical protein WCW65_01315, partial [Candidatus Paceibacterota bacterium]
SPTTITQGGSSSLSWSTSNCDTVTITNLGYNVPTSSTGQSIYPSQTTNYVLTARGANGSTQNRTVTVYVNEQQKCLEHDANNYGSYGFCTYDRPNNNRCQISNFDASDTNIEEGDSVTLTWNTRDCNSVYITDIGNISNRNYGSVRVYPSYTRTYNISASGNNGSDSDSVKIYVDENNRDCSYYGNCNNTTPSVTTYTPSNITNTNVTVSGYVNGNGSLVNSWIEFPCYGAQYGNKYNQSSGSLSTTIYNLSANTTYRYCAAAQNINNNQIYRGNQISFTTTGSVVPPPIYVNKNVVTTVATNISGTTAQLNGYITSSNYYNSSTYFEYGTTINLGSRTISKSTISNSTMNDILTGLNSNTIYFFRAVGEGVDGVSKGNIEVFKTLGSGIVKPIVVQGTTVISTESPVVLTITNKYELIGTGDLIDYTVIYKNIGKTKLSKPMVQVVLPTNVTLVNASRGTYSVDNHTLSALIEDLEKDQEGVIYIQAKVDSIPANNAQIVTTAILVYTNTNGAQENVMAYEFNVPKQMMEDPNVGSVLGASAFFAALMSIGLIGWLLILLLVLIIILIARSYNRNNIPNGNNPTNYTPTH